MDIYAVDCDLLVSRQWGGQSGSVRASSSRDSSRSARIRQSQSVVSVQRLFSRPDRHSSQLCCFSRCQRNLISTCSSMDFHYLSRVSSHFPKNQFLTVSALRSEFCSLLAGLLLRQLIVLECFDKALFFLPYLLLFLLLSL